MPLDLSNYVKVASYDLPEPTRTAAPSGNLLAQEASAVTYNQDTGTLFVLGDGGTAIVEVSKTGQLIGTMTLAAGSSPQGTEFYDPEGLTYVGNGQFVMTEERDRNLVSFTYQAGTTLTRAAAHTADLGSFVGNIGYEGVSYDPATGGFIVVKETSPEGIFQSNVDFLTGTSSNGTGTTEATNLFNPTLLNLADFADVYALSNVALFDNQATSSNLLVLSQESGKIVEVDRNGVVHSSLTLVSEPGNPLDIVNQQAEGVTMDDQGNLYVVTENGGGDINHPQLWVYAPATAANQAPTAIGLINPVTTLLENTSTATHLKVAGISVSDDGIGNNALSLSGTDAALFEVDSSGLYIKAGVALDFETHPTFNVTVNVDDAAVGNTPDASTNYALNLVNIVNESATNALYVSEVAPWASGNSAGGADWFEVTNTGTSAVSLTGWKMDDNSNSFAVSVPLNGVSSIGAGESVIFVEGSAAQRTAFINTWFGGTLPTGLQIGTYTGSGVGLSTGGDAVNLYNAAGVLQANVVFGASDATSPYQTFDNAAGINNGTISLLSQVGTNAAITASAEASVGSPGEISVNIAPIATDDTLTTVDEDSGARTISFASLLGNDLAGPPNEASQAISIISVANAVGGTAVISGTDVIFTPAANFNGTASFEYTVQDDGQNYGVNAFLSDTGVASFAIAAVNDAPALTGTQSVFEHGTEGTAYTVTAASLLTGFTDVDGDTLSAAGVSASNGSVVDNGNGTWTITQSTDFNGPVTLSYNVTDGNGGTVAATLDYTIDAVNDAPIITSNGAGDTASLTIAENTAVVTTVTSSDVDGPAASYTIDGGADAALFQINSTSGLLSFKNAPNFEVAADADHNNVYDVIVRASDGTASDTQAISVGVTNVADTHSSAAPYLLASQSNVSFQAIITTGDATSKVGGGTYLFGGIPDGIGAFDNGDGTMTVLVNQEIGNTLGATRADGAKGAYVSQLIIDKSNLSVISGQDAFSTLKLWDAGTHTYVTSTQALSRFCSADLPNQSALYNAADGLGTQAKIFFTGEESGAEGKQLAVVVSGTDAGTAFELPWMGKFSHENAVANPYAQDKTIILGTDDAGGGKGQVYVYVGDKQATGSDIDKAGLTNGVLYGFKVTGLAQELETTNLQNADFTLAPLGDVSGSTGAALETASNSAGVTQFLRPEDISWDPSNAARGYFVVTDNIASNGTAGTFHSRLYQFTFTDITHPELGGKITAVLDGTEGQVMFDNLTVDAQGRVTLQEDAGNNVHIGRVWQYDPVSDKLTEIAHHDPALFLQNADPLQPGYTPNPATFLTQDEESSGVVDVTSILGDANHKVYLLDSQNHAVATGPNATTLVEGGQLMLMTVTNNAPVITSNGGADTASVSISENGAAVTAVTASDDATDTAAYSISGGADAALFQINSHTGALSFIAAPNFEAAGDANHDNVYDVIVQASDGLLTDTQAITVSVTNVNEAPALTGAQASLAAGTEDTAYTVSTAQLLQGFSDVDGDTLAVASVSADHGSVTDNGDGTWTVNPASNYNGAMALSYAVNDGHGGSVAASLGYSVAAVNDAPSALALSNSVIAENKTTNSVVGTLVPTDVDNATGFSYQMLDSAGGRFYLNATTGVVSVGNSNLLDYEAATSHSITVKVTDAGGASYTQALTISLTNVIENQTYTGTAAANTFTASTPDNWTVDARAGNDIITTLGGNDTIFAGGGNDTVSTGAGNDTIFFTGGSSGSDAVDGGTGNDTILANSAGTVIGLSAIAGIETISSGGFANVKILGSAGADTLDFSGTTLTGITEISGGAGNDTVIGSAGDDTILGAAGKDTLIGGAGADIFVFNTVGESTVANSDHILDFVSGVDRIDLSGIDANTTVAGNQAFTFIGSADFTGLGQLRVGMIDGHVTLSANTTGNLAPDFLLYLDSNPVVHVGDFVL